MFPTLRATLYHNRRDIVMGLLLAVMTGMIFFPMMSRWQVMGDYTTHNQLALDAVNNTGEFLRNTPHFLYHIAVGGVYAFGTMQQINDAAIWVLLACFIATSLVMYWQIRQQSNLSDAIPVIITTAIVTLCLAVIMPINFFTPENLYFGYLAPHVYHNPTMLIMKPFAIVIFFIVLPLFLNATPLSRWWIIPLAILTALSLIAKPSFIIAFVPTMGLITFFLMLRRLQDVPEIIRKPQSIIQAFTFANMEKAKSLPIMLRPTYINWPVLIVGLVLPTFAVLAYQILTWTSSGGMGIDPLRVLYEWTLHYDENADQQLLYKFVMSVAFPLAVYLLHLPKTLKNFMLNTAWLMTLVSAAYFYLLVDYTVIAAGDFGWSVQIAVLLLHLVSVIYLMQQYNAFFAGQWLRLRHALALGTCTLIFALHIVAGIHWYRLHMSQYMEELIYIWW